MIILITGVAGMIGCNFAHYLIKNGVGKIIGIDDLSGGYIENLPKEVEFVQADLSEDFDQIEKVFKENEISFVFHFAAYAAEGLSPFIRVFNYKSNVISTAFLINMSIKYKIKRFIFTSSMATYGKNDIPYTEEMTPHPVDPYGIAKYACELDLKSAFESHGLEYCIILPHNVYGVYQNIWDPYRNVLGIWMYQALCGKPMTIYGDGEQTRSFSYVDDMMPCLWKSAISDDAKNQRINLGGKYGISLNEIMKIMKEVTGYEKVVYLEPRMEIKHAWCTFKKSEEILNYQEKTSLKEGLKKMWEWAKNEKEKKVKFWDKYELDEKIYSYWKK